MNGDLIYPGKEFDFEVGGRIQVDDTEFRSVERPPEGTTPDFWGVYGRPKPAGLALWIADFQSETDAREYAAWRATRN